MDNQINLILHNILSIFSALVALSMSLFLFLKGEKKNGSRILSLTMFFSTILAISHVVGVNIIDPTASRIVLMLNLVMFLVVATNVHAILTLTGMNKKNLFSISFFYFSSIALIIIFSINPDLFLLQSEHKMYFPNYYVPGAFNWVRLIFLYIIALPYMIYVLAKAQSITSIESEKQKYSYVTFAIIIIYLLCFIPNFLIYNIDIDPLWGMSFAVLFSILLIYGAIKYELFNIKVIAKQALIYATGIVVVAVIIITFNYFDFWVVNVFPSYPSGITAIISAIIALIIGGIAWDFIRRKNLVKYEFITTVSHKFRTPLTGIKWATENLNSMELPPKALEQIEYIKNSSQKLVELTDLLINTSSSETSNYRYSPVRANLSTEVIKAIDSLSKQIQTKGTNLVKNIEPNLFVMCDIARVKFVIQSFIENAIHYTNDGGIILVKIKKVKNDAVFSVQDKGIGIAKEEIPFIFEKFYRTTEARTIDTEGMGIGMFISKEVIKHHKGKIWVESDGIDQGSTFYFSLPLARSK